MPLKQLFIHSIDYLHQNSKIKLLMRLYLVYNLITNNFMCLVVVATLGSNHIQRINLPLSLLNAYFLATVNSIKDINVWILFLEKFISHNMLSLMIRFIHLLKVCFLAKELIAHVCPVPFTFRIFSSPPNQYHHIIMGKAFLEFCLIQSQLRM